MIDVTVARSQLEKGFKKGLFQETHSARLHAFIFNSLLGTHVRFTVITIQEKKLFVSLRTKSNRCTYHNYETNETENYPN